MGWTDELIHAVGTCQVLVALLTARYLRSQWCRMEWHAFSMRTVRALRGRDSSSPQSCIIPVIWAPFRSAPPEHISSALIFLPKGEPNPRTLGHYQKNGVFGLMQMGGLQDSYQIVVWQLAISIASIYHSQRAESHEFELSEAFRGDKHGC